MATIINNPAVDGGESSGAAFIIGIIGVLVLAGLFVVYLLPGLRNADAPVAPNNTEIKIEVPTPTTGQPAP